MFNKRKILYSAMVAALLTNAGGAFAAGLTLTTPSAIPQIASEKINPKGDSTIIGNATVGPAVGYKPSNSINADFNMIFTLSGGATWGGPLSSTSLIVTGSSLPAITRVGGGTANDSSVTFLVQAGVSPVTIANDFSFSFTVMDKGGVLGTSGGEIKLTANLVTTFGNITVDSSTPTASKEVAILKSKDGELVTLTPEATSAYAIDVAQGSLGFITSSGTSSKVAKLGSLKLGGNSAVMPTDFSAWTLSTSGQTGGSLLVSAAPFNASVTGGTGRVFIDTNGNAIYDAPTSATSFDKDFLATSVTDTEAKWELSSAAVTALDSKCGAACNIIIEADGTTAIQENPETAIAALSINYSNGTKTTTGKLLRIKRNGSVCTLYNIPSTAATDDLSIRVTNMGNQEGVVKGTLRGLDGKVIFSNQDLIAVLAPHQTQRVDAAALKVLASNTDWTGRAVLTISSNIKDGSMEVYGLVRNKAGGPLMNLSAGASGNGCD